MCDTSDTEEGDNFGDNPQDRPGFLIGKNLFSYVYPW